MAMPKDIIYVEQMNKNLLSETTILIESNLFMNDHWMVSY